MSKQNLHEAASRIHAALNPKPEISTEETKAEVKQPETPTEEISKEETTPEERYKVKVGEQELELTLDELKLGYMRNADYTQKSQTAKQLREQYETTTNEFSEALKEAKIMLDMEVDELQNATELREEYPEEYLRRLDSIRKKTDKFKKLKEKEQKATEAKQAERLKAEQEKLREAIPEWLDADKQQQEIDFAINLLSRSGYTDQELNTLSDHRLLVLARKAALYDQIKASDLKRKEVKEPAKVSSPGSNAPMKQTTSVVEAYKANPTRKGLADTLKHIRNGGKYR